MGKIKDFILNRKQYDRIRKMDHCTMSLWAESVYKSGYADGKKAVEDGALTIEQVRNVLLGIKGFGEKRVALVCDELNKIMEEKTD